MRLVKSLRQKAARINPYYSPLGDLFRISPQTFLTYLGLILAVELQTVWVAPNLGTLYYGFLLVIIVHQYLVAANDPNRDALLLLATIPMLRMLAMAMPVGLVPPLARYFMVGIPVALGVFLLIRKTKMNWGEIGIRLPVIRKKDLIWENILIALSGVPLGIIGYYFGDPIPLVTAGTWQEILIGILVVFIFIASLEEIVFRGILLRTLYRQFGALGIIMSTIVYLVLFASSHSIGMIFIMGFVSLLYSWNALESGSVLAIIISHGLMFTGMLIFWPLLI